MIVIGEKLNGAIPSVAEMIAERKEDEIRKLARKQAEAGADFIDVCAAVESGEAETLRWMIELVQGVTDVPVSIDSPNSDVLLEAASALRKPGLFNSVSMESRKQIDRIFQMMSENPGWEVIAMLCDDEGISGSFALGKRLQIFEEIMKKASSYKIEPSRIHIDPMVGAAALMGWEESGDSGISGYIQVVREIRRSCPEVHITSAVSNISHGLPARKYLNYSFVTLALEAGLDSGILDPLDRGLKGVICGTETLLGKKGDEGCMEYIRAYKCGQF